MNWKKFILVALWIIVTFLVTSICCTGLNAASTSAAILGLIGIVLWIVVSVETKFFTTWPFKNNKNNKKIKK